VQRAQCRTIIRPGPRTEVDGNAGTKQKVFNRIP
jgi:hypothetical protein